MSDTDPFGFRPLRSKKLSGVPFDGCETGVGHPEQTLADMWGSNVNRFSPDSVTPNQ
jgi:hypothetical protein